MEPLEVKDILSYGDVPRFFKSMGRQLENRACHSSIFYNGQKLKSEFSLNLKDFKTLSQLSMMRWRLGNLQRSFPVAGAD